MSAQLFTIQPITDWTPFGTRQRTPNPFRATWAATLDLLKTELDNLNARDIVVEVDVQAGQLRRDGMLRGDAKVGSPAVRLSFDSAVGRLSYATDRFEARFFSDPADWQINLRAIALGMEALRKVDRYGIGQGQQYAGYKALPSGTGAAPSHMTESQALQVLAEASGGSAESPTLTWKRARALSHPDRHGGDRTAWDQVEQAATVLGLA